MYAVYFEVLNNFFGFFSHPPSRNFIGPHPCVACPSEVLLDVSAVWTATTSGQFFEGNFRSRASPSDCRRNNEDSSFRSLPPFSFCFSAFQMVPAKVVSVSFSFFDNPVLILSFWSKAGAVFFTRPSFLSTDWSRLVEPNTTGFRPELTATTSTHLAWILGKVPRGGSSPGGFPPLVGQGSFNDVMKNALILRCPCETDVASATIGWLSGLRGSGFLVLTSWTDCCIWGECAEMSAPRPALCVSSGSDSDLISLASDTVIMGVPLALLNSPWWRRRIGVWGNDGNLIGVCRSSLTRGRYRKRRLRSALSLINSAAFFNFRTTTNGLESRRNGKCCVPSPETVCIDESGNRSTLPRFELIADWHPVTVPPELPIIWFFWCCMAVQSDCVLALPTGDLRMPRFSIGGFAFFPIELDDVLLEDSSKLEYFTIPGKLVRNGSVDATGNESEFVLPFEFPDNPSLELRMMIGLNSRCLWKPSVGRRTCRRGSELNPAWMAELNDSPDVTSSDDDETCRKALRKPLRPIGSNFAVGSARTIGANMAVGSNMAAVRFLRADSVRQAGAEDFRKVAWPWRGSSGLRGFRRNERFSLDGDGRSGWLW